MESGLEGRHDGRRGRPESLCERASPRFLPPLRTFSAGPRDDGVEGVRGGRRTRRIDSVGHRSLDPSRASGLAALPQGNHEGLPLRGDGFRLGGWNVGGDGRAHLGTIPESPLREGMGSRIGARDSWGKGERQGRCMEGVRSYNGKSDNVI